MLVALLAAAACARERPGPGTAPASPGSPAPSTPPGSPGDPSGPAPAPPSPPRDLRLVRVARLSQPVAMAFVPGDPALYIAEKGGVVRALRGGRADPSPVLDISGSVSRGSEQGLLGLAFAPDGGVMYVNFTNRSGDTRVRGYRFSEGAADESSGRDVLSVAQPFSNHNGGNLVFGPDGVLWVGLGDGGSGGDPQGNGQSLRTLLGKMLRIDPRPGENPPYRIPDGNPFAGREGARPEIWAYGLRNPWRYSFDRSTGDLWIGDVGQNRSEEVDFLPAGRGAGANLGWNRMEGSSRFRGSAPDGHVGPVHEYRLGSGRCAVTGGYVYRGSAITGLAGTYVFADFCAGRLEGLSPQPGGGFAHRFLGPEAAQVASFGEDAGGEIYVLSLEGGVFRLE